jgi:hypothetical protein
MRLGFASFRGTRMLVAETDPACAEIEAAGTVNPATVAPQLRNRAAIDAVYSALGAQGREPNVGSRNTPTAHAIRRVTAMLGALSLAPAGRKYLVLLTDGNPGTCAVHDPACGQDLVIDAVQDARAAGITTLAFGIGTLLANTGCSPSSMPCGERHMQDIANAGTGLSVEPPPANYWYEQCAVHQSGGTSPGTPVATYTAAGMGGSATYYASSMPSEFRGKLTALFEAIARGSLP